MYCEPCTVRSGSVVCFNRGGIERYIAASFPKSVQVTTVPESRIVDMDDKENSSDGRCSRDGESSYLCMSDESSLMDGENDDDVVDGSADGCHECRE